MANIGTVPTPQMKEQTIYVSDDGQRFDTPEDCQLWERLASKHDLVKILGRGELTAGVEVSAHQFSKSATAAIEGAGGKCSTIDRNAK